MLEILIILVKGIIESFFIIFNPLFLITFIFLYYIYVNKYYKNSTYYKITNLPHLAVIHDSGRCGEYLTYKALRKLEKDGAKFLFNVYIPKGDEKTTEIDVLMISSKGIFVFESKNYSGWIFGSENQINWYQTLPKGRGKGKSHKEQFYNPIMQNKNHIKCLKTIVGDSVPTHSIIVFSQRCTLKKIDIKTPSIHVIKRNSVFDIVSNIHENSHETILSNNDIQNIYDLLYPYTQISEETKKKHIQNICNQVSKSKSLENIEISEVQPNNESTQNTCPKCGSTLILRTATKGVNAGKQFWGCDNFPKCKFTISHEDQTNIVE